MVIAAVILLALAALFGATLLTYILRDKPTPKAIVLAHGLFAASGLIVLLIYALTTEEHPRHWAIVTIFIIVAVVGFYLFSKDIRYKKVPKGIAVAHGAIAVATFLWLLIRII